MYLARIVAAGASSDEVCATAHVTAALSWPLDAAIWADLSGAPGPCGFELVSAYLSEGRITDGPLLPRWRSPWIERDVWRENLTAPRGCGRAKRSACSWK